MRVLIITKIFPNAVERTACPFNRLQFGALARLRSVQVLATIPWFPGAGAFRKWSRAGRLTRVPRCARIDDLDVLHPRFFYVPRVAPALSGPLYAASVLPTILRLRDRIDVILGSWAYPDGFAAVVLGRLLGKPAVVKLHGSDIDVLSRMPGARSGVAWTLRNADRIVAVSRPLARAACAFGAAPDAVDVVGNGVDTALFRPRDTSLARAELGGTIEERMILFVGRIERDKGVCDLIESVRALPASFGVAFIGEGPLRDRCERFAAEQPRRTVHVLGARPATDVARWMAAADVLCLPSHHEGTPNVILEALASGCPVVATHVGGIPDLIDDPVLGQTVPLGDTAALTDALEKVASRQPAKKRVVERARIRSWEESARDLDACLGLALARAGAPRPAPAPDMANMGERA